MLPGMMGGLLLTPLPTKKTTVPNYKQSESFLFLTTGFFYYIGILVLFSEIPPPSSPLPH